MQNTMIFGAQYYRPPYPERKVWDRDLAAMKKTGFNTVKFWAVWNWIESKKGIWDFQELDELTDLAERHGLNVVLNTIPEGAPDWAGAEHLDALYTTGRGEKIPWGGPPNIPSGGWPGPCWDKPGAAEDMCRFIEKTAAHFGGRASVLAMDVWNEPHLEPMLDYRQEMLCYCDHSRRQFTLWLQEKYKTLDRLNLAWARKFGSWEAVSPPPRIGTWLDMMDWRLFWIQNLKRWLALRVKAARQGAPDMIIQTHVGNSSVLGNQFQGGLANELGDEFSLAGEVDVFGLTSFPKWLQGPDHPYVQLVHNEMIAAASGKKPFYQVELQGGAGKAGLLGGEVPDARDIRLWNFNTLAAGGKGVLYWQYAPEPAGIESPGFGLTGFLGEETDRSKEAGVWARKFTDPRLAGAVRMEPVNGVYVSRKSQVLFYCGNRREELYASGVNGIYRAAYSRGIPIRFFHEDSIESLCSSGIKVLYLPMTLVLSNREQEVFEEFIRAGGTLVGEAACGMYRSSGLLDEESKTLSRLFGLDHRELQGLPDWGFVNSFLDNGKIHYQGKEYRQLVIPGEGTRELSKFEDGQPAAFERKLGLGRAVFLASFVSLSYHLSRDEDTAGTITSFFHPGGYGFVREIRHSGKGSSPPVFRFLENKGELILFAVNHGRETAGLSIHFGNQEPGDGGTLSLTLEGAFGQVWTRGKIRGKESWIQMI